MTDAGPRLCRSENLIPFHPGLRALLTTGALVWRQQPFKTCATSCPRASKLRLFIDGLKLNFTEQLGKCPGNRCKSLSNTRVH